MKNNMTKKKTKKKAKAKKAPKDKESYEEAKRRRMVADADKSEAVMARIKGETILVTEVVAWWAQAALAIRQSMELLRRQYGNGAVDIVREGLQNGEIAFKLGRPNPPKMKQGRGVYGQRKITSEKNTKMTRKKRGKK